MNADNATVAPAWGDLPVEQYLIRNWDHSSELGVEEQRSQLVEAYIAEDVLDPELLASPPSRVPTAAEITEILSPWRPQKLRRIAAAHLGQVGVAGFTRKAKWDIRFYILRTHYGGGAADDARLRDWLDQGTEGPQIDPEDEWFAVLNDAELFDLGEYWQEVYDVLPELAAPGPDRRFTEKHVKWAQDWAKDKIENDTDQYESEDEHFADAIRQAAAFRGPPWLVVLDEEAFKTEDLGLIWRDEKGNPVKEATIRPDMFGDFYIRDFRGMTYEGYWEHSFVPKKYMVRGNIMRKLLPMVKGNSSNSTAD